MEWNVKILLSYQIQCFGEGSQDNIYSYNSNYFIDTILNFVTTNSIGIFQFIHGESDRISKLDDILYLTQIMIIFI